MDQVSSRISVEARMKGALGRLLWLVLGRRNLVRLASYLLNYGRLDVANEMESNGEFLVQQVFVAQPRERPLVVFDVGANLGVWSHHLLQLASRAGRDDVEAYLFEPSPATSERLRTTIDASPFAKRMHLFQLGISDAPGEATFYVLEPESGSHSLYRQQTMPDGVATEKIRLETIDGFCEQHGIDSIDFLKTDVEGNDYKALLGARGLLERQKIELVQFEYNHRWIQPRCLLRDAFELLGGFGYRLGKVTGKGIEFYREWDYELETFVEGNYLACLPRWVERFPSIAWWKY